MRRGKPVAPPAYAAAPVADPSACAGPCRGCPRKGRRRAWADRAERGDRDVQAGILRPRTFRQVTPRGAPYLRLWVVCPSPAGCSDAGRRRRTVGLRSGPPFEPDAALPSDHRWSHRVKYQGRAECFSLARSAPGGPEPREASIPHDLPRSHAMVSRAFCLLWLSVLPFVAPGERPSASLSSRTAAADGEDASQRRQLAEVDFCQGLHKLIDATADGFHSIT